MATKNLGIVTAYGSAVAGGYTGTLAEFKADLAMGANAAYIAPKFSTSDSYSTGDYVFYNNVLYRFVADHSAGAWNASHVEAVVIGDELAELNAQISQGGSGMTVAIKQALLQLASKVAYIDDDGQDYYDDLYDALYPPAPPATLVSISAVYTQSGTVYTTDTLESLESDLVVTALYDDTSSDTVTSYTLSGSLTEGTSTITVTYGGKTTTFTVTVTAASPYVTTGLIHHWDAIDNTASGHSSSTTTWYDLVGTDDLAMSASQPTWSADAANFDNSINQQTFTGAETSEACTGKSFEVVFQPASTNTCSVCQVFNDSSAAGKACLYSDNSIAVKGASAKTYPTGLTSVSDVNYICGTFDSNGAIDSVYVNGSAVSQGSTTHSLSGQKTNVIIGKVDSGYRFYGKVHAVRIYDKILSASEVASNYAADVTRFSLGE